MVFVDTKVDTTRSEWIRSDAGRQGEPRGVSGFDPAFWKIPRGYPSVSFHEIKKRGKFPFLIFGNFVIVFVVVIVAVFVIV
jgi:hypothetical protein